MKFTEINLHENIQEGLDAIGFEKASPVQEFAIPLILEGKDIIASAQTGTGKTAAFLLPVMDKIMRSKRDGIQAIVIAPTRELAIQIDQNLEGFSYFTEVGSIAVYGGGDGKPFTQEKNALTRGTDVVICTPGRMISHLAGGYVNCDSITTLILDEADRMLDMGFFADIMKIISYLPKERQTLLFSATMPVKIRQLANQIQNKPETINIAVSKPPESIRQGAYSVYNNQKSGLIKQILKEKNLQTVVIFCSSKISTKELARELKRAKFSADEIHSDLDQLQRKEVLQKFRSRKINIIVATDILSRGIDIDNIDMVINYDVPHDAEDYVHRIGRTARAAAKGEAYTLIIPKEQHKFQSIEDLLGTTVEKLDVPEEFGETPKYEPDKQKKFSKFRKKRPDKNRNNRRKSGNNQNKKPSNQRKRKHFKPSEKNKK